MAPHPGRCPRPRLSVLFMRSAPPGPPRAAPWLQCDAGASRRAHHRPLGIGLGRGRQAGPRRPHVNRHATSGAGRGSARRRPGTPREPFCPSPLRREPGERGAPPSLVTWPRGSQAFSWNFTSAPSLAEAPDYGADGSVCDWPSTRCSMLRNAVNHQGLLWCVDQPRPASGREF